MIFHKSSLALLWLFALPAIGATTRTLDLSQPSPGADKALSVPVGDLSVEIVNLVPNSRYRVDWDISQASREVLPAPSDAVKDAGPECKSLSDATKDLDKAATESDVAKAAPLVQTALASAKDVGCHEVDRIDRANKLLAQTHMQVSVHLDVLSQLNITVTRFIGSVPKDTWQVIYKTPDSGSWVVTYGFTFIPNRNQTYFSKPNMTQPNTYTITQEDSRSNKYSFAPSIFYSWVPESARAWVVSPALTGGLGFDLSNPVVYLGVTLLHRDNIGLVLGGVMHKESRLAGKYTPNAVIMENLNSSQLQQESYNLAWFAGLTFRFASSPFPKTPSSPTSATQKASPSSDSSSQSKGSKSGTTSASGKPSSSSGAAKGVML